MTAVDRPSKGLAENANGKENSTSLDVPNVLIERRIHLIRGHKVMLSGDLADLCLVETRALVQAGKRNRSRFPEDFMFQLDVAEFGIVRSQNVISSWGGARRSTPCAFSELGVAMLSSVLKSPRAIQANIITMRAFVELREVMAAHRELAGRIERLERKYDQHDRELQSVFTAIKNLLQRDQTASKRRIGSPESAPEPAKGQRRVR
ncbi:MAG: ORF6N domain-containing protein [Bryobacteraceae bacterium]